MCINQLEKKACPFQKEPLKILTELTDLIKGLVQLSTFSSWYIRFPNLIFTPKVGEGWSLLWGKWYSGLWSIFFFQTTNKSLWTTHYRLNLTNFQRRKMCLTWKVITNISIPGKDLWSHYCLHWDRDWLIRLSISRYKAPSRVFLDTPVLPTSTLLHFSDCTRSGIDTPRCPGLVREERTVQLRTVTFTEFKLARDKTSSAVSV